MGLSEASESSRSVTTGLPLELDDEDAAEAKAAKEAEAHAQAWSVRMESLIAAREEVSSVDADVNLAIGDSRDLQCQIVELKELLQTERAQHAATRREALQALTVLGHTGPASVPVDDVVHAKDEEHDS